MKKTLILCLALVFALAVPLTAFAKGEKIKLCHITHEFVFAGDLYRAGHVIEVSEKAEQTHLNHGDVYADPAQAPGAVCWDYPEEPQK